MKSIVITILAMVFTTSMCAQSTKVIQLSDKDAAEIKELYAEQDAIQKKIDAFKEHGWETYTTTKKADDHCPLLTSQYLWIASGTANFQDGSVRCVKDGWSYGFSYSDDFRYIVPVPAPEFKSPEIIGNGCLCANPISNGTLTEANRAQIYREGAK